MKGFSVVLIILFTINCSEGKILSSCELANILKEHVNIDNTMISTWMCIARSESGLDTSKIDHSKPIEKYGLYQVDDRVWCTKEGSKKKSFCGNCNGIEEKYDLFDKNNSGDKNVIRKNLDCAIQIQRKEGFKYWTKFDSSCKKARTQPYTCHDKDGKVFSFNY